MLEEVFDLTLLPPLYGNLTLWDNVVQALGLRCTSATLRCPSVMTLCRRRLWEEDSLVTLVFCLFSV